jgi:regulator of nucleoside diphosphate kinase
MVRRPAALIGLALISAAHPTFSRRQLDPKQIERLPHSTSIHSLDERPDHLLSGIRRLGRVRLDMSSYNTGSVDLEALILQSTDNENRLSGKHQLMSMIPRPPQCLDITSSNVPLRCNARCRLCTMSQPTALGPRLFAHCRFVRRVSDAERRGMSNIERSYFEQRPSIVLTAMDRQALSALLGDPLRTTDVAAACFLREEIERADIASDNVAPNSVVRVGCYVTFVDHADARIQRVQIVFPEEAQCHDRISVLSRIGSALIGLGPGQSIRWTEHGKERSVAVLEVRTSGPGSHDSRKSPR